MAVLVCLFLTLAAGGCSSSEETEQSNTYSAEFSFSKKVIAEDINCFGEGVIFDGNIVFLSKSDGVQIVEINQRGEEVSRIPIKPIGIQSQLIVTDELL